MGLYRSKPLGARMIKRPQLPKKVYIGYQDINIIVDDLIDCQGVYLAEKSQIKINDGMEAREALNTILHECLHGIFYTYGIKKVVDDDEKEEQIVSMLGNGLTELFIRNKNLVDWIVSHAKF